METFTSLQNYSVLDNFDPGNFAGIGEGQLPAQALVDNSLPDRGITSANLVIIYRSDNPDSIAVKDYLLENRPRFTGAYELAVNLSSATITNGGDTITQAHLTQYILEPLSIFLADHPGVMFYALSWAIPLRVKENEAIPLAPTYPSVQYQIAHLDDNDAVDMYDPYTGERQDEISFDDETALFIPLNQEAFAGTRLIGSSYWFLSLADVYNHIDWIRQVYNSLDAGNQGICISGKAANLSGTNYLLDDNREASLNGSLLDQASWSRDFILHENPDVSYTFKADGTSIVTTFENPRGIHNWGYHAAGGQPFASTESWESDGSFSLTGDNCKWYIVQIEESYATVRNNPNPPTVLTRLGFFSENAGDRSNYEGACIFLVGTVEEPYNTLNAGNFFGLFERGYPTGMAAWRSRRSIHFNCFGDIFLTIADQLPFSPDTQRYYDTVFGAISDSLPALPAQGNTGFLKSNTKLPYITVSKSGDFLLQKYSNNEQLEQSIYHIHVWSQSQDEVIQTFYDIENTYTNCVLPLNTDKLEQNCLEWIGHNLQEVKPGLYHGIVNYDVIVNRCIPTEFYSIVVSGGNWLQAISNRWYFFQELPRLVTSKFQKENTKPPYVSIPEFNGNEFARTSLTRQEKIDFDFKITCLSLQELEEIQEVIRKYFDNCVLDASESGNFLCMTWRNNTAMEKEPGLWIGTVGYELLMERDINAYGN